MQALARAVAVWQIEGQNINTLLTEDGRERANTLEICAIAPADRQRVFVNPERVAAFDSSWRDDFTDDRDPGVDVRLAMQIRLAAPQFLARPQENRSGIGDDARIVGKDCIQMTDRIGTGNNDIDPIRA